MSDEHLPNRAGPRVSSAQNTGRRETLLADHVFPADHVCPPLKTNAVFSGGKVETNHSKKSPSEDHQPRWFQLISKKYMHQIGFILPK